MAEVKGDDQLEILPKLEETNTSTTETPNKTTDKSNGQKSTRNRQRRNRSPNKSKRNRSRSPLNRTNTSNSQSKTERQVYVANIPFETKWTDLKDLFRQTVGNVSFCKIFEDEEGRSRGCGLVEFGDAASAKRAIETMNRHLLNGRAIIVKEDVECERDDCGRLIVGSSKKDTKEDRRSFGLSTQNYNTFGLSQEFLESLDIKGPLNNRLFVANLDYKVGEKKLEEIFRLAGKVCRVRLYTDTAGASKGHGTVEFDHPVEAVQAISMFREQNLYGRPMSIRMDKYDVDDMQDELPNVLPAGLEGVGKGLGVNGQPLNVGKSLFNGSIAPLNSVNNLSITPSYASPPGTTYCSSYVSPYGPVGGFGTDMCSTPYPAAAAPVQAYSGQMSHSTVNNPIAPMTNMNTAVNANPDGSSNNSAFNSAAASSMTTSGSSYPHSSNLSTIPQQVNPSLYGSNFEREFREEKYRPVQAMSSVTGVPPPAISPMNGVPQLTETVLVRNFPPTYTWQNVRDRFSEIGGVRFAELKGRGTAIVRFASDRDAQRAVHMLNGARIDGRSIEVSLYY